MTMAASYSRNASSNLPVRVQIAPEAAMRQDIRRSRFMAIMSSCSASHTAPDALICYPGCNTRICVIDPTAVRNSAWPPLEVLFLFISWLLCWPSPGFSTASSHRTRLSRPRRFDECSCQKSKAWRTLPSALLGSRFFINILT
jgi:hypothetical protein